MDSSRTKRVYFIEMMGEPGSYDPRVYDDFDLKDEEGRWFIQRFSNVIDADIMLCNVCTGETLPEPESLDGVVLAGSYHSVHDDRPWQRQILQWLPRVRERKVPVLAICGSHQLLSHGSGADVEKLPDGPYAGTFGVSLTPAGQQSPLMKSIGDQAPFQFANSEHVVDIPKGSTLLAASGPVSVAALDFGDHCYSTQFHPEGTHETLSTVWQFSRPELVDRYFEETSGYQLISNFLQIVADNDLN